MSKIPKKVIDRFSSHLKKFQAVAESHKARDVSEADTITLVKDILADMFGFDKYLELTSEQQIRGTYCDLAVKIDGKMRYLIEVKSANTTLNDSHIRQTINYGANQGIKWVALTNGLDWKLYCIKFNQPIDHEEVFAFNLSSINHRSEEDQQKLFLLCREGLTADAMDEFHQQTQLLNRYTIANVVLSDAIIYFIRREMRRLFPEAKVDPEQIANILKTDVFKRDVFEGEKAVEAQRKLRQITNRLAREAERRAANGRKDEAAVSDEQPA